jgi:hypothetical protein
MTIPEDVRVAANVAFNSKYSNGGVDIYGAIEDAILAERKRCGEALRSAFNRSNGRLSIAGDIALEAIKP